MIINNNEATTEYYIGIFARIAPRHRSFHFHVRFLTSGQKISVTDKKFLKYFDLG